MSKRGAYGSMADRVARGRAPTPSAAESVPRVRHVWVRTDHGRLPGLLIGWRKLGERWQGRVLHPRQEASGWSVVEVWLPAEDLEPAGTSLTGE